MVTLGRLLPHARGLGFKPRRGGFPSGAKNEWGLSPKAKVRVLHTAQLDVTGRREKSLSPRKSHDTGASYIMVMFLMIKGIISVLGSKGDDISVLGVKGSWHKNMEHDNSLLYHEGMSIHK
nr:hypothetical protein [Tanacetum cinerariifolium]